MDEKKMISDFFPNKNPIKVYDRNNSCFKQCKSICQKHDDKWCKYEPVQIEAAAKVVSILEVVDGIPIDRLIEICNAEKARIVNE
jgi:hypothetical protein